MSTQKIFHAAPTLIAAGLIPAQFVVVNVDGIDKIVPLPRALNFLDKKLSERVDTSQKDIEALKNKLKELTSQFEDAYKFKGDVFSLEYLPDNPSKGDCYNVLHSFSIGESVYPSGTNVAWTGKKWDTLGGRIEIDESMQTEIFNLLSPKLKEIAEEATAEIFNWNQF